MGSFLQACCITNQSIQESEAVYVIPVVETSEYTKTGENKFERGLSSSVYNTDMFKPLGFIFIAYYNDYGQYQVDWDLKENKLMFISYLNYIRENAIKVEEGENSCHDIPFDPSLLDFKETSYDKLWDTIHEAIWEGRLFINKLRYMPNQPNNSCKVHYHVSIKSHSDLLINLYDNREEQKFYHVTEKQKEFLSLSVKEQASVYSNLIFKYVNDPTFDKLQFIEDFKQDKIGCFFSGYSSTENNWTSRDFIEFVEKITNIEVSHIESLYILLNNFKSLTVAMSLCNLIYRPVHYGSQDYGNSLGNRFAYLMSKVHEHNVQEKLNSDWFEEDLTKEQLEDVLQQQAENFNY